MSPALLFAILLSLAAGAAQADTADCRPLLARLATGDIGRSLRVCTERSFEGTSYQTCDNLAAAEVPRMASAAQSFLAAFEAAQERGLPNPDNLGLEAEGGATGCRFAGELAQETVFFVDTNGEPWRSDTHACSFFGIPVTSATFRTFIQDPTTTVAADARGNCTRQLTTYQNGSFLSPEPDWEVIGGDPFDPYVAVPRDHHAELPEFRLEGAFPGHRVIARRTVITHFSLEVL